jgi:hypothetical protein
MRMSDDLPVLIEIVNGELRIRRVLPILDEVVSEGLGTFEDVDVVVYRANSEIPTRGRVSAGPAEQGPTHHDTEVANTRDPSTPHRVVLDVMADPRVAPRRRGAWSARRTTAIEWKAAVG